MSADVLLVTAELNAVGWALPERIVVGKDPKTGQKCTVTVEGLIAALAAQGLMLRPLQEPVVLDPKEIRAELDAGVPL